MSTRKPQPKVNLPEIQQPNKKLSLTTIFDEIEKKLKPEEVGAIKAIGNTIGAVGFSLDDACLYNRVSKTEIERLMAEYPVIHTYFQMKQADYKYCLLYNISSKAKESADVKTSTWLLENHFAEEYDPSLRKDLAKRATLGDDVVELAIAFVRRASANSMPVDSKVGDARPEDTPTKIHDVDEIIKK